MGKAAVMREAEGTTRDTAEYIQIRSLRGKGKRQRSQRGLAIEAGAAQARSGQKVGDGFQEVRGILVCRAKIRYCRAGARLREVQ